MSVLVKLELGHLLAAAAKRRYNFSHGRKPVDVNFKDFPAPLGAAQKLCRP